MNLNLDQLEKRLQALIEVHLLNYLPIKKEESLVAQQLAAAMQSNITEEADKKIAPHIYTLAARPTLIAKWQDAPDFNEKFKRVIDTIATEENLDFAAPLAFSLAPDSTLGFDEIKILASQSVDEIAETQGMASQETDDSAEQIPENAFLIIHGTKVFPLKVNVVNNGRRMENDLTIDDPRVSRNHAQLRAVNGRFVIFDLNSTGGTYVNSQRSHQSVLYPGDVISLAGVPLIYGQDNPPRRADLTQTTPFGTPLSSGERPTAILRDTANLKDKKEE
ncbi:MAG: FHA domain-containing protein [Anaerolineae bacterium]|nr:FHA domain-containing protein [Anaerolineae bacterium]